MDPPLSDCRLRLRCIGPEIDAANMLLAEALAFARP
jgi:hypothetical protein